jgi:hypothetical protein
MPLNHKENRFAFQANIWTKFDAYWAFKPRSSYGQGRGEDFYGGVSELCDPGDRAQIYRGRGEQRDGGGRKIENQK